VDIPRASVTVIVATPAVAPAVTVKVTALPDVAALTLAGLTVAIAVLLLAALNGPVLAASLNVKVALAPLPLSDSVIGEATKPDAFGVAVGKGVGVVFTLTPHAAKTATPTTAA
jgi:hypothetical protein